MLNKIKNNIFLKSTLVLLIGGVIGKLVGFVLRIIVTRKLGAEGMGLYSLLAPTSSLLSVLATLSYPTALSKIISEKSSRTKTLFTSIIPLSLIINIFIIGITILLAPTLSTLLKNEALYFPIICLSLVTPFISISSIIKGYFWGKQNMFPYMLSNFIEQVTRLILITLFINKFLSISLTHTISFIILVNAAGEVVSQLVMMYFFPKNIRPSINDFNKNDIKKVMDICVPSTSSKIIGSISYFLEPIVLTNVLMYVGYSKDFIVYEYGVINAYAMSLLLMPQFFTQNMATSLVPELSKYYSLGNNEMCKKRIKQIVLISCSIGGLSTLIITLFPTFFLNILYHTTLGLDYIRLLSPFTILFYVEYPLINALQALGKSKIAMKCTIISSIIRLISIATLSLLKIGMYSLILSIIINLLLSTYLYAKEIKKVLSN